MPASPLPRKGDSWVHISSIIRIIHGAAGGWHRNRHLLSYLQLSPVPRRYTALDRSLRTRYASHTRGSMHRSERTCEAAGTHANRRLAYLPRLSQVSPCAGASPAHGDAAPSQASLWDAAPSQAEHREPVMDSPDPDSRSIPTDVYIYIGFPEAIGAHGIQSIRQPSSQAKPPGCMLARCTHAAGSATAPISGIASGLPCPPPSRFGERPPAAAAGSDRPLKQNGVPEGTPFLIRIVRRSARCRKP